MSDKKCTWTQTDDCDSYWFETDCGESFVLNDGLPFTDNNMKYCCFCGKNLVEESYEEQEEELK